MLKSTAHQRKRIGGASLRLPGGFPVIRAVFHLSQEQFGLWSALAIHDTSSVVGATARYGATALAIGTTVKAGARSLDRSSFSADGGVVEEAIENGERSNTTIQWPWFILLFCVAALLKTVLLAFNSTFAALNQLGKVGLTVTLFLIGTGLNQNTLKRVGLRPLLQGLALWIVLGTGTLASCLK